MEDDFRLEDSRIAIIGLGLMGGSLAMALKGKCAALYGIDSHNATLELALDKKIVAQADTDPAKLLPQADLVVLATPIPAIIGFIQELPSLAQEPCIVLDLGSTKKDIVQAMSALPQRFDPSGGHPICGKEKLGLENADGRLFQNTPFVVTPLERTTSRAQSAVQQIIIAIGAHLIEMDAESHDRALAFSSHLPFILSSSLVRTLPAEFADVIGSGFRSTSRLAGTPSDMMVSILKSNRKNVLSAIQIFRRSIHEIESALQNEDYSKLEHIFYQSCTTYTKLVIDH